jgi:hypothetical protein
MESIFAEAQGRAYPYRYDAEIFVPMLVGGVPSDPKVAEGWIRTKVQGTEERIQNLIAETIVDRGVSAEEAVRIVNEMKNLNGFKRTPEGELCIEGRQLKAMLKEAVSVAAGAAKIKQTGWGVTRKWIKGFFPEHVFVVEGIVPLGVTSPTGILQNFPHTHNGSSIQYQEYVTDVKLSFTVITDWKFTKKEWEMIWTTAEKQGLGSSRSQGYGIFSVTRWDETIDTSALKNKSGGADEDDDGSEEAPVDDFVVKVGRRNKAAS